MRTRATSQLRLEKEKVVYFGNGVTQEWLVAAGIGEAKTRNLKESVKPITNHKNA